MHPNGELCRTCKALEAAKRSERIAEEVTKKAQRMADRVEKVAKKAQRMVDKVEKIAKEVEDRAESFTRSMPRPDYFYGHHEQQDHQHGQGHQGHHHSESHHHSGLAPATTIYHHCHHGQTAAAETSTTIVTSTLVATSTSTLTHVHLTTSTVAATSAPTAFVDASTPPGEGSLEELFGPACWPSFWFLGILLLIYSIFVCCQQKLEDPRNPKTKASTEPKPRTSSLTRLESDLTDLEPYITTQSHQIFAVTLCRIVAALYCLEGYWVMNTAWTLLISTLGDLWKFPTPWCFFLPTVFTPLYLYIWCMIGYAIYNVLDLSFSFAGELALLPVSATPSKGKKKSKNDATRGDKKAETDTQSTGSGSEGGWQTDPWLRDAAP
ncbi:hypothetical protein CEP52_003384 [Fusarium oligoseptatum]|uniref:Uncharacterized protein n=1 Tax=Fusarium oligoseptatum TaxID=2604345 RepID=A0A428U8Z1_9HYPO|nr:hypothetical protein CEP52_003384 [Fusarium oligoseptatum]